MAWKRRVPKERKKQVPWNGGGGEEKNKKNDRKGGGGEGQRKQRKKEIEEEFPSWLSENESDYHP